MVESRSAYVAGQRGGGQLPVSKHDAPPPPVAGDERQHLGVGQHPRAGGLTVVVLIHEVAVLT